MKKSLMNFEYIKKIYFSWIIISMHIEYVNVYANVLSNILLEREGKTGEEVKGKSKLV